MEIEENEEIETVEPQDVGNVAEAEPNEAAEEAPKSALEAAEDALDDLNGVEKPAAEEDKTEEEGGAHSSEESTKDGLSTAPADEEDAYKEPEGLSERASERFKKIIEKSKGFETQLKESSQQIDAIKSAMQSSNASADDMGQFLEVTRLSRSVNTGDQRKALQILDKQRNELALMIGDNSPATSALSAYPDLQGKVDDMEMESAQAMEIAQSRHLLQQQQNQQQAQMQQQQTQFQQQQAQQDAIAQVDALDAKWRNIDADYKAKEDLMMPQMKRIHDTLPPQQWAAATQLAYDSISSGFSVRQKTRPPAPISKTGMAGSGAGKPQSALEAAAAALEDM